MCTKLLLKYVLGGKFVLHFSHFSCESGSASYGKRFCFTNLIINLSEYESEAICIRQNEKKRAWVWRESKVVIQTVCRSNCSYKEYKWRWKLFIQFPRLKCSRFIEESNSVQYLTAKTFFEIWFSDAEIMEIYTSLEMRRSELLSNYLKLL